MHNLGDIVIESISKHGINVEISMKDGDTTKPGLFKQLLPPLPYKQKIIKLTDINLMIGEEHKAAVIDISDIKIH